MLLDMILKVASIVTLSLAYDSSSGCDRSQIVHEFVSIDYDWPDNAARQRAIDNEDFIQEINIISGVKIYNDEVYVTTPRIRSGVPSALSKVIMRDGQSILQPFPSWEMQTVGNCWALQHCESIEIDPNNGWMWILDAGRINYDPENGISTLDLCPAKIIVYDINQKREVTRYEFPDNVVGRNTNQLNDLVIHYVNNKPRYAYISDTLAYRLIVYDMKSNSSHFFSHPSMSPEPGAGNITISGETVELNIGINGIALSSDMKYIYYGSFAGYGLYQVPTEVASDPRGNFTAHVRKVGNKNSQGDGMMYGKNNKLYMSNLQDNAVDIWDVDKDMQSQDVHFERNVEMNTLKSFKIGNCLEFVDTVAFDENGFMWLSVNKIHKFILRTMDFSGRSGPNMMIWKVFQGTTSYLDRRQSKRKTLDWRSMFYWLIVNPLLNYAPHFVTNPV